MSPFNKNFNLISFDSLNCDQLIQVVTDVLAEVDPSNKVDIRGEDPEQTTVRILEMLRVLKFKPGPEISAAVFRRGLVQGDKHIIHPILEWLLKKYGRSESEGLFRSVFGEGGTASRDVK